MGATLWSWIGFLLLIALLLALDLGAFQRAPRRMGTRQALLRSAAYVGLALAFAAALYLFDTRERALAFLTGFIVEKSLSLDNIFVIALIFGHLAIPAERQHRVLLWGVIGALAMRAVLITVGTALVAELHWILYLFGAFLVVTGVKMLMAGDKPATIEDGRLFRWLERSGRIAKAYDGEHFLVRRNAALMLTPLGLALVLVEAADLTFAVDSIPAILAISTDPFIVFTSNAFAILGLRALYFVLADALPRFRYLKHGLAVLLALIGLKMLVADLWHVPTSLALAGTLAVLAGAVGLSLLAQRRAPSPDFSTGHERRT